MMKVPYYFFSESGHFGTKKVVFFQVAQAPYPAKLGEIISNLPWSEVFFLKMGWVLLLAPPTPTLWHDGDMICDHFPAQSFEGVKILGEMKGVPSGGRVDLLFVNRIFSQLVIWTANFFWDVKLWRQGFFLEEVCSGFERQMLSMQKVTRFFLGWRWQEIRLAALRAVFRYPEHRHAEHAPEAKQRT